MSNVAGAAEKSSPAVEGVEKLRPSLARVRRIGHFVLLAQLAGFLVWSSLMYGHFSLTYDFATYHQAWYLIAHGNLDPYSSVQGLPFWRSDSEFLLWPLAIFYWIWPHGVTLLWIQDIAVFGAEIIAFRWLCEIAKNRCSGSTAVWLTVVGVVLLAVNPWTWWGVSWDYHEEAIGVFFVALLARDLLSGRRRRAWAWVIPLLAGGAPTATYVIGAGIGAALVRRRVRLIGVAMAAVAVAYSLFIVLIHGDVGVPLAKHYGYLATGATYGGFGPPGLTLGGLARGILLHPLGIPVTLWEKRADILANLLPGGLLGLGYPALLPLLLLVLLANTLSPGLLFTEPLFQSLPIYVLLPIGTVAVLASLARRHRRLALIMSALLAAQAIGWAAVWSPRTPSQWLRVSDATARTLSRVNGIIPQSAEAIVSQGVMGRFSGRPYLKPMSGPGPIPVRAETWFVLVPREGVEIQSTASAMALVQKLIGPLHAALMIHQNDVWAFRWKPAANIHSLKVPDGFDGESAWESPGAAGRAVTTGPMSAWHSSASGKAGYVADRIEWLEQPGQYQAHVTLSTDGPVNVEVWNNTGESLLARRQINATKHVESIVFPVNATIPYVAHSYSGWGPFRAHFYDPPPGERLEIRVWSPGRIRVDVYKAWLVPLRMASS